MNDYFDIGYTCLNVVIINTSTIISSIAQKTVWFFVKLHVYHTFIAGYIMKCVTVGQVE